MTNIDDRAKTAGNAWKAWGDIITACWNEDPSLRPSSAQLSVSLGEIYDEHSEQLPEIRDVGQLLESL